MSFEPLLDIVEPRVRDYIHSLNDETDPHVLRMTKYAHEHGVPWLGHDAASVVQLLVQMIGAKRVFEFGSGFGYSTYFLARATGSEGMVYGSEVDETLLRAHRELFAEHPYRHRIRIGEGTGKDILAGLDGEFDAMFIDLDKPFYPESLELAVPRTRIGGVIIADNVLWSGRTAVESGRGDANTQSLRQFNQLAADDVRLSTRILPTGDGLSVSLRIA